MSKSDQLSAADFVKILRRFLRTKTDADANKVFRVAGIACVTLNVGQCVDLHCPLCHEGECFISGHNQRILGLKDTAALYFETTIRIAKWDTAKKSVKDKLRIVAKMRDAANTRGEK